MWTYLFHRLKVFLEGYHTSQDNQGENKEIQKDQNLTHLIEHFIKSETNWKEFLKEKIYLITELSLNDKSRIIKILRKEFLKARELKELKSIINKVSKTKMEKLITEDNKHNLYGWIYKITNLINKKVYIGQTQQTPEKRWGQHKSSARTGEKHPLYNSMRFHGIKNFNFEIIEKVHLDKLDEKEMEYIKQYKSNIREYGNKYGYNLTAGGMGTIYKYIEKIILEELILQGLKREEICQELRVSKSALYTRLNQLWKGNLREIRNFLMKSKIKAYIIEGKDIIEIAETLNMSRTYVYSRLNEFWDVRNVFDARKKFRKPIMKDLLQKATLLNEIAERLGMSRYSVSDYIKNYWKMTYTEAKHFFVEKYIKFLIKQGLSEEEITQELNIKEYSTVHKYIKKYWKMNYIKARQTFLIKPTIKTMLKDGNSGADIAQELNLRPEAINENCKRFWNLTFTEARYKYYTRPLLRHLIEKGLSLKEISKEMKIDPSTINTYINKFWGLKNYSEAHERFYLKK